MNKVEVIQQKIIGGNIDDISELQIVETVEEFLLWQGRKSLSSNGNCAYRGKYESKCAVGCLIPDCYYNEKMEDSGVECLATNLSDGNMKTFLNKFLQVLGKLQSIHDADYINEWTNSFYKLKNSLDNRSNI